MSRNLNSAELVQSPTAPVSDLVTAIVGPEGEREMVVELLAHHGWETLSLEAVDEAVELDRDGLLVVLLEVSLLDGADRMKAFGPITTRPMMVIVCESIRAGEVRVALAAGVVGIVYADLIATNLVPCLVGARVGQVSVPRAQARQIEPAALSTREKQILALVVMGCPNGEIASRLVVAESTVKSHLSSAFGKLGVRSRNEAIDLILDGERGLGMGILGFESESIAS
jgi:DNA-binding NarL/FixJ family response regulator